jgi:hypothetical protein
MVLHFSVMLLQQRRRIIMLRQCVKLQWRLNCAVRAQPSSAEANI